MTLAEEELVPPSFVGALGIELSIDGDLAVGRVEVQPSFLKPGTDRVRIGVLATLVDMVAGSPAHGVINPTVDLRVTMLDRAPGDGVMTLVCRPIKVGQRLFVGETVLHTGDIDRPFARSVVTFINQLIRGGSELREPLPLTPLGAPSYDDSLLLREPTPGVYEMDAHEAVRNGFAGTIQGGAQALLAELAGERALADRGDHDVVDLEIRYVNRVRTGPVRAPRRGPLQRRWRHHRAGPHHRADERRSHRVAGVPAVSSGGEVTDSEVRLVDDDRALAELVKLLLEEPAYGLDTEFMSERTYWAKLCLVQVAWPHGVALVDPMACDVRALADVLHSPATMITHAGASDLPILERAVGARPAGLFDVQLAAGFVGLGLPSLGSLVSILLGVRLDKSEQLADWTVRPLTPAIRKYAAADVEYLFPLALELRHRLEALGRESWAASDCELMRTAPERRVDADTAWWKIKGANSMRGEKARVAQAVAAWRERRAQRLDMLPRFVLPDLALAAVVSRPPNTKDDVFALRGVNRMSAEVATELLAAVEAGRAMPASGLRQPDRADDGPELDAAVSLLVAYVGELARAERIEKQLLATRDDVKALVYGRPGRLDSGWRASLAGETLRRILDGDAVIRLVDGGRHIQMEG